MKNSPRRLAVEILNRIDEAAAYAEPLLDAALSGTAFANPHDRGLLTELVYGTLRMRGRLDWIIGQLYRGDAAALETRVRNILRTGLYQLWYTDRIPPFAAVNEAVGIARKTSPAASGLVNALLRTALRKKDAIAWPDMAKDPEKAISVIHSHPRWLVERWLDEFGINETIAICRANNAVPPLALRVNSLKASREQAVAALAQEGLTVEPTAFSPDGLLLASPAVNLRETASWRKGLIRIQDEASQLIALLLSPEPGENLLDLCAGTGGKTLHLAALMENRGKIMAVDHHPGKLRLLREEAVRLGVTIVETQVADALALPETFRGAFDSVLLDAPCSGLGTLRRNPEIRWRLAPADLIKCMQIQKRLLRSAADCVRPGGRLIYSVCTATPEENEAVIEDLLNGRTDFTLIRSTAAQGIPPALIDDAGLFRTFPHRHGTDGFFAALLIRNA
ncbi:MAG: 16S rRNA (cytosine(967)-C(5))-methyltransferase RsmB [Proteobacteria bacterium]|nr:16S rRNA (cytosine(967)-C(5))-methyltransferase RsmB [Pseudomonadota bacterium]